MAGTIAGRPLQLAVITETYPPEINGVANTMRQLVLGMERRGHGVHLVRPRQAGDPRPGEAQRPGETLAPGLPIPGYRGLRFRLPVFWRLRRLWRRERPDLVYIVTQAPLGHAALRAARGSAIAAVTGLHTRSGSTRAPRLGGIWRSITPAPICSSFQALPRPSVMWSPRPWPVGWR